ncbi:TonB-dependent receptor [Acidicapsa ligni]|uniref:TonB-dependent receptor n=1 Tax=Acidicapsa ligni TaxID=542300 RepID=UPI0021E007BF|nr:TonB-dependent receptor [Acidicapsa ligni]
MDNPESTPGSTPSNVVRGVVADPSGAIVPNAQIDLVNAAGAVTATLHSDGTGNFQITTPAVGDFTLVVSEAGFDTVRTPVKLAKPIAPALAGPMLHIVLPISTMATTVNVNAGNSVDLTASESNADTSVMSANDLKALPIFDNDYSTAMSAFMDSSAEGTGGAGLLVDGVEANRATVSASAVQEVRINQDPYSAQYYWPGRGQMEIITRSAADHYHGQFNFTFRDSALNAQNALAATKPYEQRRVYEGYTTGPIPHAKNSSFLVSFNRAEEDQDAVVLATTEAPTSTNPTGQFQANVSAPTRDTEFSTRAAHQFGDRVSAYAQYAYQDSTSQNEGVGGQTLAAGGYNNHYHEDDVIFHADTTLSATMLNQSSIVFEHDRNETQNAIEAPQVNVSGDFVGGSAQNDSTSTEYNLRLSDTVSWTRGKHSVKVGANVPHLDRRVYDDNTNGLGTYTFAPTLDANGDVVTSALQNYATNHPSGFTQNTGDVRFVYHQQEMGVFAQDQYKMTDRFSITPGIRYDWQNFLATDRLTFSPRVSFAWVLDPASKTVLRGGGGLYYDRFGGGPLLDLVRYENARRRSLTLSLNPATQPADGCVPVTNCVTLGDQPANLAQLQPNAKVPYQIQYGLSVERGFGKSAVAVISAYSVRGVDRFRSVDINAPTPQSNYTERPNPEFARIREMQPEGTFIGNGMDISFHGELNKYFTGFGRYTWSHFESNQEGISWFPQNQQDPNDEWANSSWDRRNRLGMYAIFNHQSVANLALGIFANSGSPWTVQTGADLPYNDLLFNARPDGVARNTETLPSYVDLDVRWGHDFHLTQSKEDESPKLGFSAGAFNVLNHENGSAVDQVESSTSFGQVTSVAPARRIQLAMRFEF